MPCCRTALTQEVGTSAYRGPEARCTSAWQQGSVASVGNAARRASVSVGVRLICAKVETAVQTWNHARSVGGAPSRIRLVAFTDTSGLLRVIGGANAMRVFVKPLRAGLAIPQLSAQLIEIDRTDQHCSHGNLLPEGWEPKDNEAVEQHDGDNDAD